MNGFARREFQLVLLRRMADYQPDLVAAAMASLGSSHTEMRQVNARWQRIMRSSNFAAGRRRLEAVLGPPAGGTERQVGDVVCAAVWWPLQLWPELVYEALIAPDGLILHEWLVRPDPATTPSLNTVDDLAPWSCVVDDVARRFTTTSHRPDSIPSRWHLTFTAPGQDDTYVAHFVWGLLQTVTGP
jgi:hypothetical protein